MATDKNVLWQHLKQTIEIVLVENGRVKFGKKVYSQGEKMPPVYMPEKINTKVGIAVAVKGEDGKITIGWSKRNKNKETKRFDSKFGYEIAKERATKGYSKPVPRKLKSYIMKFADRAARYFKTDRKSVFVVGIDI